ncbi:hypothetical protein BGX26_010141 [Mortierella sp. AD094]|nr:hypothetical protein BGX26_010141 [Mortierella sp. AD094]
MVRKLWCKDGLRLQKSIAGKELTPQQIKILRPYQIDQFMTVEIEYLGYLALKGFQDSHQLEFDERALLDAMEELDQYRLNANQEPLPLQLLDTLKQTSFLHTADADLDAGQLESEALELFFELLQGAPYDLIGGRHQQLLAGCLKEARPRLNVEVIERLEVELFQWLNFEMALCGNSDSTVLLGRQSVYPEGLLIRSLNRTKVAQKYVQRAFKYRSKLTISDVTHLKCIMDYADQEIKIVVFRDLNGSDPTGFDLNPIRASDPDRITG